MSPRPTWLHTRSTELRAALLDLGLTITDTEARNILDDKVSEYATLMRVTRQTAQRDFTDERLLAFAQSLADEAPGADLIEFERAISMPVAAVGLTTAALAEALKVAHINLDDKEAVAGLSLLSTLGMITADASAFLVPTPPHARCSCASPATSTAPQHPSPTVRTCPTASTTPTDNNSRTSSRRTPTESGYSPTPKTAVPRACGAPPTRADRRCSET